MVSIDGCFEVRDWAKGKYCLSSFHQYLQPAAGTAWLDKVYALGLQFYVCAKGYFFKRINPCQRLPRGGLLFF